MFYTLSIAMNLYIEYCNEQGKDYTYRFFNNDLQNMYI